MRIVAYAPLYYKVVVFSTPAVTYENRLSIQRIFKRIFERIFNILNATGVQLSTITFQDIDRI